VNREPSPIGSELDIRSLRYFVAAAEELHFSRAAARVFVAQQVLSRSIRSLERRLGMDLFDRTTRRVTLTADGERLLEHARQIVALHDRAWAELHTGPAQPVVVDLLSEGRLTGARILEAARRAAPDVEFRGRYGGGAGGALERLRAGEVDVVFGRLDWLDQPAMDDLERRLVRLEPLALLLPADHPMAERESVGVDQLRGQEIDANPARANAPEWSDFVRQFLALCGAYSTPPHVPAVGLEDQGYHLVRQGLPIPTSLDHLDVPGGVIRPIVNPVPLYAWSMAWRTGAEGPGLAALRSAAASLAAANGWLELAGDDRVWLPLPDATRLARGELLTVRDG